MRQRRRTASADRRTPAVVVVVACLALFSAACADPVTEPAATGAPEGPAVDDVEPEASDPGRAGPENRLPDDLLAGPGVCVTDVEQQVLDTINTQLDELAQGDFVAALAQATTAFQAGTDADAFRSLIEDSFPLLLEDADAALSACVRQGPSTVEVTVDVATADRVRAPFVYRLRLDEGRWGIEAAARLSPPPATA